MTSSLLHQRLRSETQDLHTAVEALADLPASVRTRTDYAELLATFHDAHACIEDELESPRWDQWWLELGVDIPRHRSLHLLVSDLASLGVAKPVRPIPPIVLSTSAQALGCLYVLEGSSLGRKVLCPLLEHQLGAVPTAFFGGTGHHTQRWRTVQCSLSSVSTEAEQTGVVLGARVAFGVFIEHLRRRARARSAGCP